MEHVQFERISQLGMPYFRYIPIISPDYWNKSIQEFYESMKEVRRDLNVLDTEGYWDMFLQFYYLERSEETPEGGSIRLYRLKRGVSAQFPSRLAKIYASPSTGIQFESNAEYLESKTGSGRMSEFIILKGDFNLNFGTPFNPIWAIYELD